MPTFRITWTDPARQPETVQADGWATENAGRWVVLRGTVLVIGQPREIVVRRLPASDVATVTET